MKPRNSQQHNREMGLVWYLIPLGWALAAVLAFAVLVIWPELFLHPLPTDTGAIDAFSLLPSFGAELSVPDAGRVFKEQPSPAGEHVQAF
jgi:hypothetical protein